MLKMLSGPFFIILAWLIIGAAAQTSCRHNNVQMSHGTAFLPEYEDVQTSLPGMCTQCNCHNGVVYCENLSCSDMRCQPTAESLPPCCKWCMQKKLTEEETSSNRMLNKTGLEHSRFEIPKRELLDVLLSRSGRSRKMSTLGDGFYEDDSFNVLVVRSKKFNENKPHCLPGMDLSFKNGSKWLPKVGPLGVMPCVECSCTNTVITCKKFPCPNLSCANPIMQFGSCCPVCPAFEQYYVHCLPDDAEVLYFRYPRFGLQNVVIEYAFVMYQSAGLIDLHVWDMNRDKNKLTSGTLPTAALKERNLVLAGYTSLKKWHKFLVREDKLRNNCKVNCAGRVVRMEDGLKLKPATLRKQCLPNEVDSSIF